LDRGLILGDTTFGKGSVQSVLPIDENRHMKMTTAYYYTPSGRCINRPENKMKGNSDDDFDAEELDEEDVTSVKKDTLVADTSVYFTKNGRKVFGGGGIIPDTIVKTTPYPFVIQKLHGRDMFFKFANFYYPTLEKKNIVIDTNFVITDKILGDFYDYLDSTKQDYDSFADKKYRDFKVYLGLAKDTTVDTASLNYLKVSFSQDDSVKVNELISQLDKIMKNNRDDLLKSKKELVLRNLRNAFFVRKFGQDNEFVQRNILKDDEQLIAALNIIKDRKKYNLLLSNKNDNKTKK
jgi:carboxyl-terminal processing protease